MIQSPKTQRSRSATACASARLRPLRRPLRCRVFTGCGCGTAAGVGQPSLSLRRSCQGNTTLSQSSRAPRIEIAIAERDHEIQDSEHHQRRQQLLPAEFRQRDQHRGVEHADRARRMAGEAEQRRQDEHHRQRNEIDAGLRRHQEIHRRAQNPRSTTPIRICSSVSRAEGSTTFQPFWPSSRRFSPMQSQIR